jgi:hypothetical protein
VGSTSTGWKVESVGSTSTGWKVESVGSTHTGWNIESVESKVLTNSSTRRLEKYNQKKVKTGR